MNRLVYLFAHGRILCIVVISTFSIHAACGWEGIRCDHKNGRVVTISLPNVGIEGTIPTELGFIQQLETLNLSGNRLAMSVPRALLDLPNLVDVNLQGNELKGTVPVFVSKHMESLVLSENHLTGELPDKMSSHNPSLVVLDLSKNKLTGTLPPSLVNLSALVRLDLSFNRLHGVLPFDIGKMKELRFLVINNNALFGTIPHTIPNLVGLADLYLQSNQFSGNIPESLSELDRLENLFLNGECGLYLILVLFCSDLFCSVAIHDTQTIHANSCSLPSSLLSSQLPSFCNSSLFLLALSQPHIIVYRTVSTDNKFTGTVPLEICSRTYNRQYFAEFPDSIKHGATPPLDGCSAVACPVNTKSETGVFPCTPCPASAVRHTPYLGWPRNCMMVNEKSILDHLYYQTHGPGWHGGRGWADPAVTHCQYEGVSCNDQGHVVNITLSDMNLGGRVPDRLGRLGHVRVLDLSDNRLTGVVPSDIRHMPLEELDLTGNLFDGPLPPLLCMVPGINDNGMDGEYSCDHVLCPEGTAHWSGRAPSGHGQCMPCPSNHEFLGQKHCHLDSESLTGTIETMARHTDWALFGLVLLAVIVLSYILALFLKRRDGRYSNDDDDDALDKGYYVDNTSYGGFAEYGAEDMTIMSYPEQSESLPTGVARSTAAAMPPPTGSESTVTPPDAAIRQRRHASPEEDPATQDLWLDVPKIA